MFLPDFLLVLSILPIVWSKLEYDPRCSFTERTSPSGEISSPGYPSRYPDNTTCKWLIIYPRNATLTIRVTDVDIEDDVDCESPPCCTHNWLSLESGQICGRDITNISVVLANEESKIKFHTSKGYHSGRGFRLIYHVCRNDQFQCVDNHSCIDKHLVCDGIQHCDDRSDEWKCDSRIDNVEDNKFRCADSGRCVDDLYVCNGENDCNDGSDEANCIKNSIITAVVMGSLACGMIAVLGAAMGWRYYYNRCAMPAVISVDGGGGYRRQTDHGPLDEASLYHLYRDPPPSYNEAMRQDGNTSSYFLPSRYMNMTTRRMDSNAPATLPRRERSSRSRPPQSLLKPPQLNKPPDMMAQTSSQIIAPDQLHPESSIAPEQDATMLELSDNNTSTSGTNVRENESESRSPTDTSMSSLISCESQLSYQNLS